MKQKNLQLTVCGGGTLEWPPGVETLTLVSTRPFSAMLGIAMTVPPDTITAARRLLRPERGRSARPRLRSRRLEETRQKSLRIDEKDVGTQEKRERAKVDAFARHN